MLRTATFPTWLTLAASATGVVPRLDFCATFGSLSCVVCSLRVSALVMGLRLYLLVLVATLLVSAYRVSTSCLATLAATSPPPLANALDVPPVAVAVAAACPLPHGMPFMSHHVRAPWPRHHRVSSVAVTPSAHYDVATTHTRSLTSGSGE